MTTPEPIKKKNRKYCPECWKQGTKTELRGSRQFLCKRHYKIFRNEREANRIRFKRKRRKATTATEPHIVLLGNASIGPHLRRKKDGIPNFDRETTVIRNEKNRVFKQKTPGDIAKKNAGGGKEAHLPEIKEEDKPVYTDDLEGYIVFGGYDHSGAGEDDRDTDGGSLRVDEWRIKNPMITEDVDLFFKKTMDYKPKTLIEKYKDWEYYKD